MKKSNTRLSLEKEYRKLAKRADQRLVRLEEYAGRKGFSGILSFAYRVAMRDIRSWSGPDGKRFNVKPPENTNQLKAKIADIKKFLESDTSVLGSSRSGQRGVLSIYEQRAKTINDKYGTNFSWEDLAKFFDSAVNEKMDSMLDSEAKMIAIARIQANEDQIVEQLKKGQEVNISLPEDDDVIEFEVNKILNEYGIEEISKLFGSN